MDASFALQDRLFEENQINVLEDPPWIDPDTPLVVRYRHKMCTAPWLTCTERLHSLRPELATRPERRVRPRVLHRGLEGDCGDHQVVDPADPDRRAERHTERQGDLQKPEWDRGTVRTHAVVLDGGETGQRGEDTAGVRAT